MPRDTILIDRLVFLFPTLFFRFRYEPVRDFYHKGGGDPPLSKKILAGLTTGAIGITIASPTYALFGTISPDLGNLSHVPS